MAISMNTCATCKHLGKAIDEYDLDGNQLATIYHVCDYAKHEQTDWEKDKTRSAYVIDGSGYYAALCVRDDFGCLQWEQK